MIPTKKVRHPALPAPRNTFFGREAEQAGLATLLGRPDIRVVTLVGPPGVGKTRLALQVAWALETAFDDGLYWVALTPLTDPAEIPATICRVAGLPESTADHLEQLSSWLQARTVLLILDNCEQLNAPERVIAHLLDENPGLSLLLTSRIPLDVYGERLFPVAPLPTGTASEDIKDLVKKPALALFQGRAREVQPELRSLRKTSRQ